MRYIYFVSWLYMHDGYIQTGNCEARGGWEIKSIDDIKQIAEYIADRNDMEHNPTIMSYQLLRVEDLR